MKLSDKKYNKNKALAPVRDNSKNTKLEEHRFIKNPNHTYWTILSAVEEEIHNINCLANKGGWSQPKYSTMVSPKKFGFRYPW